MGKQQKLIVLQIPSEAHAERLVNERLGGELSDGWLVAQMVDHNGLLVLLLERQPA